jgi:hypothetical protein
MYSSAGKQLPGKSKLLNQGTENDDRSCPLNFRDLLIGPEVVASQIAIFQSIDRKR